MATARMSNPLALAVLTLLSERPMHPYEMSSTLRERRKEDSIKLNYGSLYAVVESLQKRGLIEARETVREGRRPERTIYEITDAGLVTMVDWLSDLISVPEKEFPRFEAALSLMAALPPDDVIRLLEQRLSTLQLQQKAEDAVRDQAAAAGFPRVFVVESDFNAALLTTEIAFVRDLLKDMRAGKFTGLDFWRRMHELRDAGVPPEEIQAKVAEEFKEDFRWIEELANDH